MDLGKEYYDILRTMSNTIPRTLEQQVKKAEEDFSKLFKDMGNLFTFPEIKIVDTDYEKGVVTIQIKNEHIPKWLKDLNLVKEKDSSDGKAEPDHS